MTNYIKGTQKIYNIQPTKMEELIKRIEALMTENEAVKNNAIKAITTKTGNDQRSTETWSKAKAENFAYQNVLDLIKDLKEGKS
jgi:hypothetical protein